MKDDSSKNLPMLFPYQSDLDSGGANWQVYDMVEVFAGIGSLSKCLQIAGYNTAALDITYWSPWIEQRKQKRLRKSCKGNPLNLLSAAGFAFLDGKFGDWIFS